jgi:large subunit ribosomal protein L30
MAKLKITQTRSTIGCLKNQIATMEALGLRKNRSVKIHDDNAVIRGMIDKVKHLVSVEEIEG